MRRKVTDYFLYRWRFIVGYGIIAAAFVGLLLIAGLYIPGGLSKGEMNSTVISHTLSLHDFSFNQDTIVNLPYHLLQKASLAVFGVSAFSIKLPSLLLAALTGIGMLLLLQTWFKRNIAILTSVLIITTGQFLFVAQNGTPAIVYMFLSVWLLVAATMVSRKAKYVGTWKIVLLSVAALSLYTPLSAYILIALASAVVLHPHLRYLVRQALKQRLKVVIAICAGLIVIAPLVYATILHPAILSTLFGIPTEAVAVGDNIKLLAREYFNFLTPTTGALMTPIYGIGSMILMLLGILNLLTTNYTARSYIISAWVILLVPILLINPASTSVVFVPAMLVLAMGIKTLLDSWYQLFPRNPYARLAGLVPLIVLIGGIVLSGVDRYIYGYLYDPKTADNFSNDLRLATSQLGGTSSVHFVVTPSELPFYQAIADYRMNVTASATSTTPATATTIVSRDAHATTKPSSTPWRIVTDGTTNEANRFYIYKTDVK